MCLAASSCNPAEQESGNITNSFLHAARANALCHTRLQTRIAGVLAQIDQRSRSISSADFTTQIRRYSLRTAVSYTLFCEIELLLQYRALFVGNFPRSRPAHHTSRPLKPPYLLYPPTPDDGRGSASEEHLGDGGPAACPWPPAGRFPEIFFWFQKATLGSRLALNASRRPKLPLNPSRRPPA